MKYFGLLLFLVVLANGSPAVKNADEINPFVMGGMQAMPGQFPSAVFIDIPGRLHHCGGTIVHVQHVVTAAHCVVRVEQEVVPSQILRIIAGDVGFILPTFGRVQRQVSNVFIHPGFNQLSHEHDIAVLRLSAPFEFPDNFLEAAILRRRIVPDQQMCIFAGWGVTGTAGITPTMHLNVLNIINGNPDWCNGITRHEGRVLESMLCGLSAGPLQSVCFGNDGSGLYCDNELTGILSFGVECNVDIPGAYIQVRYYNDWLNAQFARNDTPEATIW